MNGYLVFSSIAFAALAAHAGGVGFGFGLIVMLVLIPLFWILVIGLFAALGRRRWAHAGQGSFGRAPFGASRGAESTLAERFANGDIDETEYRARREVLRTK